MIQTEYFKDADVILINADLSKRQENVTLPL